MPPTDLAAIRERHHEQSTVHGLVCAWDDYKWPCDTAQVLAALDGLTGPDVERLARALMVAANNGDRETTQTAYATAIRIIAALADTGSAGDD